MPRDRIYSSIFLMLVLVLGFVSYPASFLSIGLVFADDDCDDLKGKDKADCIKKEKDDDDKGKSKDKNEKAVKTSDDDDDDDKSKSKDKNEKAAKTSDDDDDDEKEDEIEIEVEVEKGKAKRTSFTGSFGFISHAALPEFLVTEFRCRYILIFEVPTPVIRVDCTVINWIKRNLCRCYFHLFELIFLL